MNQIKKVLLFSVLATFCLLVISIFIHYNRIYDSKINNIDIISSITTKPVDTGVNNKIVATKEPLKTNILVSNNTTRVFKSFEISNRITNYNSDSNKIVLENFIKKLFALQSTKKGKIRIAYCGDSMIEGDLISQTLRKLLQQKFGGSGVGFVPVTSAVAGFRQTVAHTFTGNFKESNFKQKTNNIPLYLSGRNYFAFGYNKVELADNTAINQPLNKYFLYSYKPAATKVVVNGAYKNITPTSYFNKTLVETSNSNKLRFEISDPTLPLYGFSFESNEGIIVDNFSFRGLGGFEFANIDTNFLKQINKEQPYDLIIMQYGVNVLNNPNNNSFGWYEKAMINCIQKMKNIFSTADFLVVSNADKSFKYNDGVHTAIGMDNLISTEQRMAFETNSAFFNTYKTMGGYNSLVKWANSNPQMAAKDGTHLNGNGAEFIGNALFNGLMYEFGKLK